MAGITIGKRVRIFYTVVHPNPEDMHTSYSNVDEPQIKDGCLVVRLDGALLAIFAPGSWTSCHRRVEELPEEERPDTRLKVDGTIVPEGPTVLA